MTTYGLLPFITVFSLAVALPGPGVAVILARGLTRSMAGTYAFIAGITVADLVWFTCAASGLAALAQNAYNVFLVLKFAGAAYLLYLAYGAWKTVPTVQASHQPEPRGERGLQLYVGGMVFTFSNPKAIVFYLALLPSVMPLERLTALDFVQIAACIALIVPLILCSYAWAAARARKFFASERALRRLNRSTGAVMAGAAVMVAVR